MSYGDMERDMNSIAQHAVANGYGKIEYLRAQPIARSSRVTTTASASNDASSEVARRGAGSVVSGFAMSDAGRIRRPPWCPSLATPPVAGYADAITWIR